MAVLLPTFEIRVTLPSRQVHLVRAITQINVSLSSEKPCDTAEVHVPTTKKAHLELFKPSNGKRSQISISFGYVGQKSELTKVFEGDIVWVSPNLPLVLKAEDIFHCAKHSYVNETYCKGGKREFYSDIAKDVLGRAEIASYIPLAQKDTDWKPHSLELKKQTVAQAMAKLSEETQWVHFTIPGTRMVYFGPDWPHLQKHLPSGESSATPDILAFRIGSGREGTKPMQNLDEGQPPPQAPQNKFPGTWGNIISASSLTYRTQKPYSKVICNLVDREQRNTSVKGEYPEEEEEFVGAAEGQQHSFTEPYSFDQGKKEAEMQAKARAEKKFHELNAAQYEGSFTTFGNPLLSHSQLIWLESVEHPAYSGYYDAKAVTFNYSPTGGFRMTVEVRKPPDDLLQEAGYG